MLHSAASRACQHDGRLMDITLCSALCPIYFSAADQDQSDDADQDQPDDAGSYRSCGRGNTGSIRMCSVAWSRIAVPIVDEQVARRSAGVLVLQFGDLLPRIHICGLHTQ